jgi:hypothetical protein
MAFDLDTFLRKAKAKFDLDRELRTPSYTGKKKPGLVILSHGLGRDSSTILALVLDGKLKVDGKKVGTDQLDAVVFSDTGYELDFTMNVKDVMAEALEPHGVPFFHLETPPARLWKPWWKKRRKEWLRRFGEIERARERGQTAKANKLWDALCVREPKGALPWRTDRLRRASIEKKAAQGYYQAQVPLLERVMERSRPIILHSKKGRSAECTVNHKIMPIRHWLSDFVARSFPEIQDELNDTFWRRNNHGIQTEYLNHRDEKGHVIAADDFLAALKVYGAQVEAGEREPITMMIGYAADEAHRVERGQEGISKAPGYVRAALHEVYPLVEAGVGKPEEIRILERHGWNWIRKSGCSFCPEAGAGWFWALSQYDPAFWKMLLRSEQEMLRRNPLYTFLAGKPTKALGRPKTLQERVDYWRQRNPTMTVNDVFDKGYSRKGSYNHEICGVCGGYGYGLK